MKRAIFLFLVIAPCCLNVVVGQNLEQGQINTASNPKIMFRINESEYWNNVNPMSFIDTLIFYGDRHVFNIEVEPPKHWFDEKYISKLNNHRSDSGYCASVMMPIAEEFGDFYCGSTTVTQQVEYLIDGIRKKRYPYTRSSSCFFH